MVEVVHTLECTRARREMLRGQDEVPFTQLNLSQCSETAGFVAECDALLRVTPRAFDVTALEGHVREVRKRCGEEIAPA